MIEKNLALLISGAGYGINILVLAIIAAVVWGISLILKTKSK